MLRLLLLKGEAAEARRLEDALRRRYDVRGSTSTAAGELLLQDSGWRPDAVLVHTSFAAAGEAAGLDGIARLATGLPVLLVWGSSTQAVVGQLKLTTGTLYGELCERLERIRVLVEQHEQALARALASHKLQIAMEVEQLAVDAASTAAEEALQSLMGRLGLGDAEGVRLAVRLARGWEAARLRFLSALVTGLASAFLLALGAGIVAVMRSAPTR